MSHQLLFIQAYSPLHAGVGQGIGVIDLPIARERATNLPYLPGSSLKGALRAGCDDLAVRKRLFGPDTANASDHAGTVQFSDQTLLLFPVRSLAGTFAAVTSPYVLSRVARDAALLGIATPAVPDAGAPHIARLADPQKLVAKEPLVVFEDLDFTGESDALAAEWAAWIAERVVGDDSAARKNLGNRLVILHDDVFNHLVAHATEVTARIKLQEDTKTVQQGGLWYEEALPAESVLWGLVMTESVKQGRDGAVVTAQDAAGELKQLLGRRPVMQLGGKATVGRGLCRVRLAEG